LALRRKAIPGEISQAAMDVGETKESGKSFVKIENADESGLEAPDISGEQEEPDRKKPRGLSLEEYEAALDQDTTFDDVDLNIIPGL